MVNFKTRPGSTYLFFNGSHSRISKPTGVSNIKIYSRLTLFLSTLILKIIKYKIINDFVFTDGGVNKVFSMFLRVFHISSFFKFLWELKKSFFVFLMACLLIYWSSFSEAWLEKTGRLDDSPKMIPRFFSKVYFRIVGCTLYIDSEK